MTQTSPVKSPSETPDGAPPETDPALEIARLLQHDAVGQMGIPVNMQVFARLCRVAVSSVETGEVPRGKVRVISIPGVSMVMTSAADSEQVQRWAQAQGLGRVLLNGSPGLFPVAYGNLPECRFAARLTIPHGNLKAILRGNQGAILNAAIVAQRFGVPVRGAMLALNLAGHIPVPGRWA